MEADLASFMPSDGWGPRRESDCKLVRDLDSKVPSAKALLNIWPTEPVR